MNEHASRPEMVPRIPPRGLALAGVLALLAAAGPSPVDATRPPPIDVRAALCSEKWRVRGDFSEKTP